MKKKRKVQRRNPMAQVVWTPQFRSQVVRMKTKAPSRRDMRAQLKKDSFSHETGPFLYA